MDTFDFNSIVKSFTNGNGTLLLGDVFELKTDEIQFGGISSIELSATDTELHNLDSIEQPKLFEPLSKNILRNDLVVGVAPRPLMGSVRAMVSLLGDGIAINNDFRLSLEIEHVEALADLMARIQADRFLTLKVSEILGMNCLVATLYDSNDPSAAVAQIEQLLLAIRSVRMDVSCIKCSSPLLPLITARLQTEEGQQEIQQVVDYLLNKTQSLVTNDYNARRISHMVEQSYMRCMDPNHEKEDYSSDFSPIKTVPELGFLMSAAVIVFTLILFVSVVVCCVRTHRRTMVEHKTNWKKTLRAVRKAQRKKENEIHKKYSTSLITEKNIPLVMRILIPLIIIVNILLFLSGHLSLGATVKLALDLMGEKVRDVGAREHFSFYLSLSLSHTHLTPTSRFALERTRLTR